MKKLLALALLSIASLAYADPEVSRHQFTSAVVDREPTDLLSAAENLDTLYYFTELTNFQGMSVTHRWLFNDNVMAEVTFAVGGPRWRVYSSKLLQPEWDGQWQVEVVDEVGVVVSSDSLMVQID
ncbi:DUF2914 domain-containing protein [Reinekea sp.]|jgi:hypothetical protein|uniref:DUF2914 domain-containing protein n=1 Tax=Reinekea sp. TaxID=1970455 RepID=UPI002A7ED123|nr:DUF2914 domain-containing protein [Reinekea sp.]